MLGEYKKCENSVLFFTTEKIVKANEFYLYITNKIA
jgi:hypothetical protein